MKTYSFENLNAWQESRLLIKSVYEITMVFPEHEKFGLTSQMRRAAVSIASNIAEGSGRNSKLDKKHFYRMAYSSLLELLNQSLIAQDLNYISVDILLSLRSKVDKTAYLINQLSSSLK